MTTRRTFFGYLGSLLAAPFVRAESQPSGLGLTYREITAADVRRRKWNAIEKEFYSTSGDGIFTLAPDFKYAPGSYHGLELTAEDVLNAALSLPYPSEQRRVILLNLREIGGSGHDLDRDFRPLIFPGTFLCRDSCGRKVYAIDVIQSEFCG